jgi:hypothetical protein
MTKGGINYDWNLAGKVELVGKGRRLLHSLTFTVCGPIEYGRIDVPKRDLALMIGLKLVESAGSRLELKKKTHFKVFLQASAIEYRRTSSQSA